uniref:Large ribosomal subunit protein uL18c n=1 Tax=Neogoniolithon spectabile TaxID=231755 RepID=A0A3G3MGV3_9FLOR|nr:ribosomal protein L18 [Neogoniolithon spectabile]AYR06022.1 ribosomal protein L18 [Neogoniolithon spectabile]
MNRKLLSKRNRPRLRVFRSRKHIYAQVIDNSTNTTLAASSSLSKQLKNFITSSKTCKAATIVGQDIGNKLKDQGITQVIFDRGNKIYHGRIRALAEATRITGINF